MAALMDGTDQVALLTDRNDRSCPGAGFIIYKIYKTETSYQTIH